MFSLLALAGAIGGLLLPISGIAAERTPARVNVPEPAASAPDTQPRMSPYAAAARRQAQAASSPEHNHSIPPTMQRTQRTVSRVPPAVKTPST
jgi:hypothetical protein